MCKNHVHIFKPIKSPLGVLILAKLYCETNCNNPLKYFNLKFNLTIAFTVRFYCDLIFPMCLILINM